ncbi:MAG: GNAT family N-acetyltransferase [Omnitrophica WOR_2 bacterium]
MTNNLERLIHLAEKTFAVKNDPSQLDVNQEVLLKLQKIHPSTVSEYSDDNGPVAWLLLIPTTSVLMDQFISGIITEKELFELTPPDQRYDTIYLCSALVLEEYRRKGITKKLALKAIEEIRKDYPIKSLFIWPFTEEGNIAADVIAKETGLPLYKKESKY